MRLERLEHLGKYDWYLQIGESDGKHPFMILLRHFTGCGFRLTISLHYDYLIRVFGFNTKIFGV